jgi:hypothetical protein
LEAVPVSGPLRLKVIEVGRSDGGADFLIADETRDARAALVGNDGVYALVADRLTADIIVKSVNCFPELLSALVAVRARFQTLRLNADQDAVLSRVNAAIQAARGEQPAEAAERDARIRRGIG